MNTLGGRSVVVHVRLTETERARIKDDAAASCLTMSAYLRKRVLGHPVISKVDMVMVNELRRQGGLLKHALTLNAIDKAEADKALRSIQATIKRMGDDRKKD